MGGTFETAAMTQADTLLQAGRTAPPRQTGDVGQAREAALEFEAVFLAQMLAPMFQGLDTEGYFGGSQAEGMYRSLLVEEYGKVLARSGGVGIADAVQREILKLQEIE